MEQGQDESSLTSSTYKSYNTHNTNNSQQRIQDNTMMRGYSDAYYGYDEDTNFQEKASLNKIDTSNTQTSREIIQTPNQYEDNPDVENFDIAYQTSEVETQGIFAGDPDTKKRPDQSITEWQAGWNVTNAIQGMFLVSFPYTVLHGGYWAMFSMIAVAIVCCHTGKILVECLYEITPSGNRVRLRSSYVEIAEAAWGRRIGSRIVNCAQLTELLMTCILYVLLCGEMLYASFPDTPLNLTSWTMIASIFVYPCAFLKTLRHVSWLSFFNGIVHCIINGTIIIYCFTRIGEWHWSEVQIKFDIWTFPISLGVIVFSYTSQIFLPTLEGNMIQPEKFTRMMHWTHVAAATFKVIFGWIGFLAFGKATAEVITDNLPTQTFKIIINLILITKALLSYPLPYFAAAELLENTFFIEKPATLFSSCWDKDGTLTIWALALRLVLCVFTVLMAIIIPHFSILMGFIGSFTGTMLSFLLPCYFHLKLKKNTMTMRQKIIDIAILVVGSLLGIIGMYYSLHALIRAFQGLSPDPVEIAGIVNCQFTGDCAHIGTDGQILHENYTEIIEITNIVMKNETIFYNQR